MKKLFAVFLFLLVFSSYSFSSDKEDNEYDNPGYYETLGMVGIYGFMHDFTNKYSDDRGISGGAFAYFNALNTIYGNFSIGLSSDYTKSKFKPGYMNADLDIAPIALNLAYMTSSDFINGWAGLAFTYTIVNVGIKDGFINGVNIGRQSKDLKGVIGGDAFVGLEYIFTKNKMFGAFFEFRYSLTEKLKYQKYIPEQNIHINDKIDLSRMKFTLGISFHF